MSIADDVRAVLLLEAFADEAKAIAAQHRAALNERARRELDNDGIAPSWNLPAVAKVTLGVTKAAPFVADPAKFTAWVAARYPDEMEQAIRSAFAARFLTSLAIEGDCAVDKETGEIVPGIGVRRGGLPANLTVKADPGIKAELAEFATQMLAAAHPAIGPAQEAPVCPPADPWIPSGDPFAAFPARGES